MVWSRRDDKFPEHPKVWNLSDGAFRLHDAGMCKSSSLLMDGLVDDSRLPGMMPVYRVKYLRELEAAGMWHAPGHGCERCPQPPAGHHVIHDYLHYHRSKAEVLAEQEANARRQRRWRESRRDETRDKQRESRAPRPDPARRATGRVSEEPSASMPSPAPSGGDGLPVIEGEADTALPAEFVQRNVSSIREIREGIRG